MEHVRWSKTPHLSTAQLFITEKVDGTNIQLGIRDGHIVLVGSRRRIITPDDDNHGFAAWARDHEADLVLALGDGRHYGEWAGPGIQGNRHDLPVRRLHIFEGAAWRAGDPAPDGPLVRRVPVLLDLPLAAASNFRETALAWLEILRRHGSLVRGGWPRPDSESRTSSYAGCAEGVVVSLFSPGFGGGRWKVKL